MNPIIAAIPKDMVPIVWPLVVGNIQEAIGHSNQELTEDVIYDRLCKEDMILLTVSLADSAQVVAAITVEKRIFDTGKEVLVITTAGGTEADVWLDELIEVLDSIAKEHRCEELYIIGRSGWERKLKKRAFNKVHTVLSKKVT